MLTPQQEELQTINALIDNATFALHRAAAAGRLTGDKERECLHSIANSLIAIAKLLQLQAEQD